MFFVVVLCVCRLTDLQEQLTILNQQLQQLQEYQQYANTTEEVQYNTIYIYTYKHTYINMYIIIIYIMCVCTYTYDTYVSSRMYIQYKYVYTWLLYMAVHSTYFIYLYRIPGVYFL